jgi:hypothetical protein
MSNASGTLDTPAITCPEMCTSTHAEGDNLHLGEDKAVTTLYGKNLEVSAFYDENKRQAGVYVGDYEVSWEQASALANIVRDASYAAAQATLRG